MRIKMAKRAEGSGGVVDGWVSRWCGMAHEEPAEIINSDIGKTTITTYRIRREKEKNLSRYLQKPQI